MEGIVQYFELLQWFSENRHLPLYSNNLIFNDDEFRPSIVTDNPNEDSVSESCDASASNIAMDRFMQCRNMYVVPVHDDGHCLLHAIRISLSVEGIGSFTEEQLGSMLSEEIDTHLDFYQNFVASNDLELQNSHPQFFNRSTI